MYIQLRTQSKCRCHSLAELVNALKKYSATFTFIFVGLSFSLLGILGSGDTISILFCQGFWFANISLWQSVQGANGAMKTASCFCLGSPWD